MLENASMAQIAAFSVMLVFGLMIFSYVALYQGTGTYYVEGPISKNAHFSPRPGFGLTYNASSANLSETVSFMFSRPYNGSCTAVGISGRNATTCVAEDGTDSRTNRTLSPGFFFFAPWMLAASDSLNWQSTEIAYPGKGVVSVMRVNYSGECTYMGRKCMQFAVSQELFNISKSFIVKVDKSERVLLEMTWGNGSVRLIEGYFTLRQKEA
jgi:hypothetical protein